MSGHKTFLFIILGGLLVSFVFQSCKSDEQTGWDTAILAPLAETTLSLEDLIADSLIVSEPGQPLIIRYENTLSLIPSDSLFRIPDTTFTETASLPIDIGLPAGFQVSAISQLIDFEYKDVQITEAIIKSGSGNFSVTNTIPDIIYFNYGIPKAFLNQAPLFYQNQQIPAASVSAPYTAELNLDLAGYFLDLTGDDGLHSNQLRVNLDARLNPAGDGANVLANQPLILYNNTFKNIIPYYAKGFLGTSEYTSPQQSTDVSDLKKIEGMIRLQDVTMDLQIENSVGADFSFLIDHLTGIRTTTGETLDLSHSLLGNTQLIGRAQHQSDGVNPFTATIKNYSFNSGNSNIKDFFELLPDRFEYSFSAHINPLGNISSGNDFIYNTSNINLKYALQLPLTFSANAISFTDTIATEGLSAETTGPVQSGELRIIATNGFPFDLSVKGYLLDENKQLIDSLLTEDLVAAADVNTNLKVEVPRRSTLSVSINSARKENLDQTRFIVLKARINTKPEDILLPMYADYRLKLQLIGDGIYRVSLK